MTSHTQEHMSSEPARRRRRRRLDVRLLIGLGLVAASIVGVWAVVDSVDDTVEVYVARDTLTLGDGVGAGELVSMRARLGAATTQYLTPAALEGRDLVVTRTVISGELVPLSAVGAPAQVDRARVVVDVDGRLPAAVAPGATVDVWAARAGEDRRYGPPTVLVAAAEVSTVVRDDSFVADGRTVSVEILIARADVATVLEALAAEDALNLVPVGAAISGAG